jgi:2-dehydro-3-deoxyphosphogluconate aldolase/(4S)-4-hydroxy-2-oxoglutarate aldolase
MSRRSGSGSADVIQRIGQCGVVPVAEVASVEDGPPLMEALLRGGLDAIEVTLRSDAGLGALELLRSAYPEALVGAGTVRTPQAAERVLGAGAQFVVSPSTNLAVIELCRSQGTAILPGVCTPTEIDRAVAAGVATVKFFPAEAMGGISFLKAVAGPFRDVTFVPTGGINISNLSAYLALPQVIACGGTWLVERVLVDERRFDEIERLTREAVAIVREVRAAREQIHA